ncbi:polyribonucleotide nucleotidyltransferase [Desulfococcaceae bacterium HSG7]|nr:polyribonucleotide nucleotidyltransferase [Desulfococcaceae bacterium HSG9]MDM8554968.1 polyribonucleotide nucleotidyltransferase [Desulfococcaceae bacterium HSG7]
MEIVMKANVGGRSLEIQTGKIAKQASGAVVVQYGETVVLVTAVAANTAKAGLDFLPLTVEYQEKIYSAGRIPGNYFRREIGRPSEKETLTCRLIDRPIRPLFPKGYTYETQIIATVLSMDKANDPDLLALVGASAALEISDLPYEGPIAAVRVGRIDGQLIINPTINQYNQCDINIVVAGSATGVVMVEGGGSMVSEADMLEAIFFGHNAMQPLIELQEQMRKSVGKSKRIITVPDDEEIRKYDEIKTKLESIAAPRIHEAMTTADKMERQNAMRVIKTDVHAQLDAEADDDNSHDGEKIDKALKALTKQTCRALVLNEGRRIDGRRFDEVRKITCEVGLLPIPHGSALFTRGETQVLGVLTLGTGYDEQRIETLNGDENRSFMLHYNFPPYSVGEVRRLGGPGRRDIGHGNLAARAIEKVLPVKDEFDYTIRLVSEVFESNGSSSMGTVCSGIMALMDGGVPIKTPVSGIAMGLVKEDDKVVVLSDILGDEDHTGDMDFKVAGTEDGITALQMDIKINELSKEIMEQALEQARVGRLHILLKMREALTVSRESVSPNAPKVETIRIKPDKIRDIIGPGGKIIRMLQSETNTRIEVDDSGLVKISAMSSEDRDAAVKRVNEITVEPEVGRIYDGKVVKIMDFGAFVQIMPGTDGLCHISQLAQKRITRVSDVVKEGDNLKVKVLEISRDGKIRLSHKAVLNHE